MYIFKKTLPSDKPYYEGVFFSEKAGDFEPHFSNDINMAARMHDKEMAEDRLEGLSRDYSIFGLHHVKVVEVIQTLVEV